MPGGSALVPRGGLGGKIFSLEAGETRTLVFALTPDVRAWLKSYPRTTLIVQAKASDDTYENKWQTTLRLRLVA
jgi:hypothetical protein